MIQVETQIATPREDTISFPFLYRYRLDEGLILARVYCDSVRARSGDNADIVVKPGGLYPGNYTFKRVSPGFGLADCDAWNQRVQHEQVVLSNGGEAP